MVRFNPCREDHLRRLGTEVTGDQRFHSTGYHMFGSLNAGSLCSLEILCIIEHGIGITRCVVDDEFFRPTEAIVECRIQCISRCCECNLHASPPASLDSLCNASSRLFTTLSSCSRYSACCCSPVRSRS